MKFILPLLLTVSVLYSQSEQNASITLFKPVYKRDSAAFELKMLKGWLDSIHPGEYMHCSKTEFERYYDSLISSITADLSEPEYYLKVSALLSKIKDGHTSADNSAIKNKLKSRPVFPFSIYQIQDRFVISKSGNPEYNYLVGSTITTINGKAINEIVSQLKQFVSIEGQNLSGLNYALRSFPFDYFFIDSSTTYSVGIVGEKSTLKAITVQGIAYSDYQKNTRRIVEPISKELKKEVALLTVNTFYSEDFDYKKINYKKYLDKFFKEIKRNHIQNLIIDVRGNGGGSAEISNYLFSWLTDKPYYYFEYVGKKYKAAGGWKKYSLSPDYINNPDTLRTRYQNGLFCEVLTGNKDYWWFEKQKAKKNCFKGNLAVLVDGGCFSTTGHFLTLLRDNKIGKFYGTCSQGSSYSNDGSHTFRLPYSKMLIRIPTAQFKMKVTTFNYSPLGICPDVELLKSAEDFKNNYDSELNFLLEHLIQ